jgi:hypothetical protein
VSDPISPLVGIDRPAVGDTPVKPHTADEQPSKETEELCQESDESGLTTTGGSIPSWCSSCSHTYFDGRSAVTQVKWSDKGFVGRCKHCGEIIEN